MKKKLTVVVVGLGNFGAHMALALTKLGHTVIAIDTDEDRVQKYGRDIAKAVVADASSRDTLPQLGLADVDLAVVSMGDRIDSSALATLHLKAIGIGDIWVKVISSDHAELMRLIGATKTIFPERDTADRLARRIHRPNIVERLSFDAEFGILEFTVPETMINKSLIDLDLRRAYGINVIGVKEVATGNNQINPDPTQPLAEGDILFLLGNFTDLEKLQNDVEKS